MAVNIGDVVRLKCGGTPMVVGDYVNDNGGQFRCFWWGGPPDQWELRNHLFSAEALEPAEPLP